MRVVVQRADGAHVTVADQEVGRINGPGLVVLLGVTHDDDAEIAHKLANKVYDLRLFDIEKMRDRNVCIPPGSSREVSAGDLGLPVLVVSQFTLYAKTGKGRRPTWDAAAPGPVAEPLVNAFVDQLRNRGAEVATGRFGADMRVHLVNDGPITLVVELP